MDEVAAVLLLYIITKQKTFETEILFGVGLTTHEYETGFVGSSVS